MDPMDQHMDRRGAVDLALTGRVNVNLGESDREYESTYSLEFSVQINFGGKDCQP